MLHDSVKNFGIVSVDGLYLETDFTITLENGEGSKLPLPPGDQPFNLTWWNYSKYKLPSDDPNKEIVRCTTRVGDILTLDNDGAKRIAQESTTATSKNSAGSVYKLALTVTAKMIIDMFNSAISGYSGYSGIGTSGYSDILLILVFLVFLVYLGTLGLAVFRATLV